MKSILKNETWIMVNRPKDHQVIGSRIVLCNKYKQDGTIDRRKARLVARGYAQRPGIDFKESFAPVTRKGSIRLMLALAAENNMTIHHFDVTTAFLNGKLEEEIFMEIPEYAVEALQEIVRRSPAEDVIGSKATFMLNEINQGDKVCLLKRALYGLRQAGRCWYTRIDDELLKFGARRSSADTCIYVKGDKEDLLIIAVYVDDILVASRNMKQIASLEEHLRNNFEITG